MLTLRCVKNKLDLKDLIPYTKMVRKDAIALARECGCSVKKTDKNIMVRLSKLKIN